LKRAEEEEEEEENENVTYLIFFMVIVLTLAGIFLLFKILCRHKIPRNAIIAIGNINSNQRTERDRSTILKFFFSLFPPKKLKSIQNIYNIQSCVICFDDYQLEEKVIMLDCHHIFHSKCFAEWAICPDVFNKLLLHK
jgi:hypothetical protein